jgi:hypothetical protein
MKEFSFKESKNTNLNQVSAAEGASGSVVLARRFPKGTPHMGDLGQKSTNSGAEFGVFWLECHKICNHDTPSKL